MLPKDLTPEAFAGYPPEAKRVAVEQIGLLRQLPLGFVALLLREVIGIDWKFPAERRDVERQFQYLGKLSPQELTQAMAPFDQLRLSRELEKNDWVNSPAAFTEQLTAHLWTTHQIDPFRQAAVAYMQKATAAVPDQPPPTHRLAMIVIGKDVDRTDYRLFRKLSTAGVTYTNVNAQSGLSTLIGVLRERASKYPEPYAHWYIDGGTPAPCEGKIARVSWAGLAAPRSALQSRMQRTYEAAVFDPEAFRSMLARTKPEEIGLAGAGADAVLNRFQLSILTEGSGTQVFATTFVQWAAREALRRAQPMTMLVRFAPRQRDKPMNELLAEAQRQPELDPQGSLVDADMGAYYTWLNQQRLSGAEKATFIAWFEGHNDAVVIGPSFLKGKRDDSPTALGELLTRIA